MIIVISNKRTIIIAIRTTTLQLIASKKIVMKITKKKWLLLSI
jgi:hypothetical protein